MAIVSNLIPVQYIGLHHIALYRAFFEDTLNLADIADQYLETGRDIVEARHALLKTQDALLVVGRRINISPRRLSLIMLPPAVRRRSSEVEKLMRKLKSLKKLKENQEGDEGANIISFEEFIADYDPNNILGHEEQLECYYAEVNVNYLSATQELTREELRLTDYHLGYSTDDIDNEDRELTQEEKIAQLHSDNRRKERVQLINTLASQLVKKPSIKDPVEGWFHPNVASRLMNGQLFTLGHIIKRINLKGWNWFQDVPKLGKLTANRIKKWIYDNSDVLEDQIHPFAMERPKETRIVVVNKNDPLVIDAKGTDLQVITKTTGIVPMELFHLPEQVNGTRGKNRADLALNKLNAQNDLEAINEWLSMHTENTALSYKKEAERLLLWSIINQRKSLADLSTADFATYREFLKNPQPASLWVSTKRYPRMHPNWKPFSSKVLRPDELAYLERNPFEKSNDKPVLSEATITYSYTVLNGLFEFLVSQQYLQSNPIKAVPKNIRGRKSVMRVDHTIPVRLWTYITQQMELTPVAHNETYRTVFMIKFLYMTGLRLEEITNVKLGDFFAKEQDDGRLSWRLKVIGKGDKLREVFIVDAVLQLLKEYLNVRGLSTDPRMNDEDIHLITAVDSTSGLNKQHVYNTLKSWFKSIAGPLKDSSPMDYKLLNEVSTHWLRHTFASRLIKKAPLTVVMKVMGHTDINTTSLYLSNEEEEGEKAMEAVFQ